MKIEQIKTLDISRIGADQEEGIKASISDESLPFMFEMLSRSLYSNPIGSLIREITSNCFDSHIEAKVDNPVTVSREYEESEWYITFKDVGIGLSKERITNIYMNYFSSTKRDTNTQIGGFGLGSKSPLSYTDLFYITTIYDGIKYDLILHKGEALPELESLYGWETVQEVAGQDDEGLDIIINKKYPIGEETDEHNGTVVKIPVEIKDVSKFETELKFQLAYFDNVWFTGWNISNNYDIYEGKYFKFRSDIKQSDTEAHICLGNVRYRIDWNQLKDIPASQRKMPVAIKFQIGEIQVTPNREDIRYKDETKALIKERLHLAFKEITDMFKKQNPIIWDLEEYIKLTNEGKPKLVFDKQKDHTLHSWANSGLESSYQFGPVSHLPIKMPGTYDMFFMYSRVGSIDSDGKANYYKHNGMHIDYADMMSKKKVFFPIGEKDHIYTNFHINSLMSYSEVIMIRRCKFSYRNASDLLGLTKYRGHGKAKIILEYYKIMTDIIVKSGCKPYSEYKPTDQWVVDYKRSLREASPAYLRRINNKVFIRDIFPNDETKGVELPLYDLQNRPKGHILVYGFKDDREVLTNISRIVAGHRKGLYGHDYKNKEAKNYSANAIRNGIYHCKGNSKAFRVIQIAQNLEKNFENIPRTGYWYKFFVSNLWKELETAYHIKQEIRKLKLVDNGIREELIKGYKEAEDAVFKIINPYISSENESYFCKLEDYFSGVYNEDMIKVFNHFKDNFVYNIPLINCLKSDTLDDWYKRDSLIQYLKERGIRLTNKCYLRQHTEE